MREKFRGYYGLDESEKTAVWDSGLIVVDTNVLLGLYGQSQKTRQTMVNILEGERERLWIPHQVALEFQRNKDKAQRDATSSHRELDGMIISHRAKVQNAVKELKKYNVTLDLGAKLRTYERAAGALAAEVTREKKAFAKDLAQGDSVLEMVEDLYPSERVGDPFRARSLSRHRKLGAERFAAQVPPGYADAKTKTGDRVYGDYFLWVQLIAHAKRTKRDVIWVTNDQKDDWVDPQTGEFYPALTDEFVAESGQLILLYKSADFVEEAKRRLASVEESDDEIDEAAKELDRQGKVDLATYWIRDIDFGLSDVVAASMPKYSSKYFLGEHFADNFGLTQLVAGLAQRSNGILTEGVADVLSRIRADVGAIAQASRIASLSDGPRDGLAQAAGELARQEHERKQQLMQDATGIAGSVPDADEDDADDDEADA